MKPAYINNIPVHTGEITVLMHENATTITEHACRTAQALHGHGLGVLVLNCAMSGLRFKQIQERCITDHARNTSPHVYACTMEKGNVADERQYVEDMLRMGIAVVIVSGWEWTSSSYRRKQRLLHIMRSWAEQGAAVIVYSQSRTKPVAGTFDRGGLGWLAAIAFEIRGIDMAEQTVNMPQPPPLVTTEEDREAADRSAQLLVEKLRSYGEGKDTGQEEWREAA